MNPCSAVDNVLLKLDAAGVPLLRLGRASGVDARLREHTPGGARHPDASVAGLRHMATHARVVRPLLLPTLHCQDGRQEKAPREEEEESNITLWTVESEPCRTLLKSPDASTAGAQEHEGGIKQKTGLGASTLPG